MAYDDDPNARGDHVERTPLDEPVTRPDVSTRNLGTSRRRSWLVGIVAGATLVAILLVAVVHAGFPILVTEQPVVTQTDTPAPGWTPLPTQTPAPFPSFTGWRILYDRIDGLLHAISVDATQDTAGPALETGVTPQIGGDFGGGMSPDGRSLLFLSNGQVVIGSLRPAGPSQRVFTTIAGHYIQTYWSPDSATIALSEPDALALLRVSDLHVTPVPLQLNGDRIRLLGWIDGSHLAIVIAQTVVSVALDGGSQRVIIPAPPANSGLPITLALAPDGSQILSSSYPIRSERFAPFFDLISTKTGLRRHLAAASQTVFHGIESMAWKPGTSIIAITAQLSLESGASGLILIDTARDTVTHVAAKQSYALGWASDGSDTLIMGDCAPGDITRVALHVMEALTISPASSPKEILLTDQMIGPFLGFIRTEQTP